MARHFKRPSFGNTFKRQKKTLQEAYQCLWGNKVKRQLQNCLYVLVLERARTFLQRNQI